MQRSAAPTVAPWQTDQTVCHSDKPQPGGCCAVQRSAAATVAPWQTNQTVCHSDKPQPAGVALCNGRLPRPLRHGKQIKPCVTVTNLSGRVLRCATVARPDRCTAAPRSRRFPQSEAMTAQPWPADAILSANSEPARGRLSPRRIVAKVEVSEPHPVRQTHADQGYGPAHLDPRRPPEVPHACNHSGFAVVTLDNVIQP